jgi:hypothetical protein
MYKKLALILGGCLFMNLALAGAFDLPPGDYQNSCYACTNFNGKLDCFCKDRQGFPHHTSITIKPGGYITNNNGQLQYVHRHHRRPWPPRPRPRHKILRNIKTGPIWNNIDAQNKCPAVCRRAGGKWTGQWHTVRYGRQSVCECRMTRYY